MKSESGRSLSHLMIRIAWNHLLLCDSPSPVIIMQLLFIYYHSTRYIVFSCSLILILSYQSSSLVSMKILTTSGEYIAPCTIYPKALMLLNAFAKHCKSVSPSHGPSLICDVRVLPTLKMKMLGGWELYGLATDGWKFFSRWSMKIKILTWAWLVAEDALSFVSPVLCSVDIEA